MRKKTIPSVAIWSPSSSTDPKKLKEFLKFKNISDFYIDENVTELNKGGKSPYSFLYKTDNHKIKVFKKIIKQKYKKIILARGGYGAIRLLPLLDKIKISKQTKLELWGYSDSTTIQLYFYNRFKWPWVHSPLLTSKSFYNPSNKQETNFWKNNKEKYQRFKLKKINRIPIKTKTATLIGGNLTCLISLMGTPWDLNINSNFYLALEDVNEKPGALDRKLWQLSKNKKIKFCQAILLGHFTNCPDAKKIIIDWSKANKIPLFDGLPIGHESPNIPILFGEKCTISKKGSYSLKTKTPILFTN